MRETRLGGERFARELGTRDRTAANGVAYADDHVDGAPGSSGPAGRIE